MAPLALPLRPLFSADSIDCSADRFASAGDDNDEDDDEDDDEDEDDDADGGGRGRGGGSFKERGGSFKEPSGRSKSWSEGGGLRRGERRLKGASGAALVAFALGRHGLDQGSSGVGGALAMGYRGGDMDPVETWVVLVYSRMLTVVSIHLCCERECGGVAISQS